VRAVVGVITAADERPITNRSAVLAQVRGALEHGCGNLLFNQRAIDRRLGLDQHHNRIFTMVRDHRPA